MVPSIQVQGQDLSESSGTSGLPPWYAQQQQWYGENRAATSLDWFTDIFFSIVLVYCAVLTLVKYDMYFMHSSVLYGLRVGIIDLIWLGSFELWFSMHLKSITSFDSIPIQYIVILILFFISSLHNT